MQEDEKQPDPQEQPEPEPEPVSTLPEMWVYETRGRDDIRKK